MTIKGVDFHRIKQIAYVVPDIRKAARRHSALFGSGPYFIAEGYSGIPHVYRGKPWAMSIDSALGQWGDVQIELIQPTDQAPSIFREGQSADSAGPKCHHVCFHPDSLDEAIANVEAKGYPVAFDFTLPGWTRTVLMDTLVDLGHFVEFYERTAEIAHLYGFIERAGAAFDGTNLIRPIGEIFA
ncbi:MAG: VOC family protein [Bradyrhizobium sp.]